MKNITPVVRYLLIANVVIWGFELLLPAYRGMIDYWFGLNAADAGGFHLWQPLTYMFLHANFSHLFCNMFAVLMFAPILEREWGSVKFTVYYFVCGLGAAAVQLLVWHLAQPGMPAITIGASGAVFGVLLAFGWLFPDVEMFIMFVPIPIRARTLVIVYAVIELFAGFADLDNVAHFAHLGGMLFGALLILWWQYGPKIKLPRSGGKRQDGGRFANYHYQEPLK